MRKYKILFILLLIILANGWSQAQTVALRVPDTTLVAGNIIDVPIYADNNLAGMNVTAYTLQLTFNQYYLEPTAVIVAGTISAPYGAPAFNTSIPGKITIANAGSTSLTGIGKFILIRFKALQPGGSWINFTGTQYNFFNEGTPVVSLADGYVNITTPPSITVYPDNGIITKGEQLQFNVSGGTTPFQWLITNSSVATIDASGLLTGTQSGFTKVIAQDNNGIRDTTKLIEIRAMRLSIPSDLSHLQGTDIDVPVNTTDLSGLNIISGSFAVSFNQNILTPIGIVQTGTLLASYPLPEFNLSTPGYFSLAFAGKAPLTGNGTLVYVRFHVSSQNAGATGIDFASGLFNETLLPTFTNGYFNTINLPVLSISPNTGDLIAGETRQLTVNGGGIPPFTWSINNTDAASINQTGLMTAKKSGVVKVTVDDSFGANASSGNFQIYDTRIEMPDTVTCPESRIFYYPIRIKSLPSGESVISIQATINYNTSYLTFLDIETTGTLTQGWTYSQNPSVGQLIFAGSGTSSFNSTGTILKLKFNINPNFITGSSAYVNLNNITLNEGFPLPLVDSYGTITGANPGSAGTITGTATVCHGQNNVSYSVPEIKYATGYVWTLPTGATIATGNNTNFITVNYSNTAISGTIKVYGTNGCGNGPVSPNFDVLVNPLPANAGIISGTTTVCQGQNSVIYTVPIIANATSSIIWTLPAGATGTSTTNSITVNYGASAVSGNITVKGNNSCGDGGASTLAITVNTLPASAGPISGTTTVCQGQNSVSYTVAAIANAASYIWTLPTGATGISTTNSITVNYETSAVSGNITVKGNNDCGDGVASTLAITVNSLPASAGAISGNTTVCQEQNSVNYTVPAIANATSYIWTLPAGATGTSTTNSITVNYGTSAVSGNITVKGNNSCGDGGESSLAITVNPLPASAGTISGTATVCQGQNSVSYTVPTIANATSYIWTLPAGAAGTSTTNSITVNYGTSAVSDNITVKGNNSCGDGGASTLAITVNTLPASAGTISGTTTVCQGQNSVNYTVAAIANAASYIWTLPTGATGISTTNSITVNYGTSAVSGNITVKGNNSCGDGTTSTLAITVNPLPASAGIISGFETVCQGQTSVSYTVPTIANATSYIWTLPAGATGTSTTNSITVNYGTSAVSGYITVKGNNSCGDGGESSLAITVNLSCLTHFSPIWTGNGIDHMNINLYSAKLDGIDLEAGDEIGIFDGNICVGAGALSNTISQSNTLDVVVSRNDGSGNGYTPGNAITFKLFDSSSNLEYANVNVVYSNTDPSWSTDGKFAIGATAFAELTGFTKVNQDIALNAGWNIISANVVPTNLNLKDIFQTLIDAGKLKKVMDETGKTIENFGAFGGWKNNIGNLNTTKGYKVNVTVASTLSLEGVPVPLPLDINLNIGWNIISYPCGISQDAKALVQSLIDAGKLKKVMDEAGKTIENFGAFGGWKNNIGNFVPGKGYKVNVTQNCILTIPATTTKAATIIPEVLASTHFAKVFKGNGTDHMSINLVNLQASGLVAGDEIGVFDGKLCIGSAIIGAEHLMAGSISIPASANDEISEIVNGYTSGHPVALKLFRNDKEYTLKTETLQNSQNIFVKGESMFAQVNIEQTAQLYELTGQTSVRCYPNPFTDQINIEIQLQETKKLEVRIYDVSGKLVRNLFKGKAEKWEKLVWDAKNGNGVKVVPGTYVLKANGQVEKIVLKN